MNKRFKILIILSIILAVSWLAVSFFSQDKKTAEEIANKVFSYPLPPKTKLLEQGFDYGVGYGGGPWGSGGRPTLVVYKKLYSELSEKEVYEYYKESERVLESGFEIYFEGDEEINKTFDGKRTWYEGKTRENLHAKDNTGEPIEFIVQVRTEFTSAFGALARY
ncbi:hypothetical protein PB01_09115 [Psychrobacillus glaciei]|uniref:Uncharacterized protein n=1 Tax=Psychrobacillus glaciei TaxID=2283160 RepID=A0A5J6SLV5_9BACI|nr:hypothetical protein [Psychrobacillus glaciei]QFF98980.1 hypothetical protein PB01_09115 [Psychrobacillus glaciei]